MLCLSFLASIINYFCTRFHSHRNCLYIRILKKKCIFLLLLLVRSVFCIPTELRFTINRCVTSLLSVWKLMVALWNAGLFIRPLCLRSDVSTTSASGAILIGVSLDWPQSLIGPRWKERICMFSKALLCSALVFFLFVALANTFSSL